MKLKKGWLVVIITLITMYANISLVKASVSSVTSDGVIVTVETDKDTYALGEEIKLDVKIENTNSYDLVNIKINNYLPTGLSLASNSNPVEIIDTLKSGESYEFSVLAISESTVTTTDTAKTGDYNNTVVYTVIVLVSVVCIGLLMENKKRVKYFAALIAVGTTLSLFSSTASAASTYTINVKTPITFNNEATTIETVVTYEKQIDNTYTVTFKDYDGTVLNTQTVTYGKEAIAPILADRIGYEFTGWDVAFNNVKNDIITTAQYKIKSYTVTFKDWDDSILNVQTIDYGQSAIAPITNQRDGYDFLGWDIDYSNVTDHITVKAQYKVSSYLVIFKGFDNAELSTKYVANGASATAPIVPEVDGYLFVGWDKDFSNITSDLVISAVYVADETGKHVVVFKSINGSVLKAESVADGTNAVAPAAPVIEGYDFIGWDTDFSNVTTSLTITATYKVKTYTVTFVNYDGSELKKEVVEHGSNASAPVEPSRTGYTFIGWNVSFDYITANTTVVAEYKINSYEVQFLTVINGLFTLVEQEQVTYGSSANAPIPPVIDGYEFIGWDTDFSNVTSNLTTNAQYKVIVRSYTVTFINYDGSELKSQVVEHGSNATAPVDPVRYGYVFAGWSTSYNNVTSNLTISATYSDKKVCGTFTVDLGNGNTQDVTGCLNVTKAVEAIEETNKARVAEGIEPLVLNEGLMLATDTRAAELVLAFSHTRPDGTLCFTVSGDAYAENIAMGQSTASIVVSAWLNSPGHRANIMNSDYKSIGISCFETAGGYYWVQLFGY